MAGVSRSMKFSEVVMKLFVLLVSFFASTSLAFAADIWTYESGEALHVVWTADGSDSYRVIVSDPNTGNEVTAIRTFESSARVAGLVSHQVYRIAVVGDALIGDRYVCYNLDSVAVAIDQAQLNAAVSHALPPDLSAGRVVVGVPGYWGFVELANTTATVQRVTIHVGGYSLPVVLQPGEAWATIADRVCPEPGQWAAWCDAPTGVFFRAGWSQGE